MPRWISEESTAGEIDGVTFLRRCSVGRLAVNLQAAHAARLWTGKSSTSSSNVQSSGDELPGDYGAVPRMEKTAVDGKTEEMGRILDGSADAACECLAYSGRPAHGEALTAIMARFQERSGEKS